ncbi:MAG: DUF1573 domain-containing protein [Deltaproteobacteria bacterium]|nr:DUF1573 domain-containing protein [Deltaproteobacteria bacterium]
MKKLLYDTFFLIFLISLNLSTVCAQQTIGPRMVIEKPLFDAQQVKEGEIIRHSFTVLNKGDQPLQIKRVQPG